VKKRGTFVQNVLKSKWKGGQVGHSATNTADKKNGGQARQTDGGQARQTDGGQA